MRCELSRVQQYSGKARHSGAVIIATLCTLVSGNVVAHEAIASAPEFAIGLGAGDVSDDLPDAGYGIEYRHLPIWRNFRPVVGYSGTTKSDWYLYAGARYFFRLSDA